MTTYDNKLPEVYQCVIAELETIIPKDYTKHIEYINDHDILYLISFCYISLTILSIHLVILKDDNTETLWFKTGYDEIRININNYHIDAFKRCLSRR